MKRLVVLTGLVSMMVILSGCNLFKKPPSEPPAPAEVTLSASVSSVTVDGEITLTASASNIGQPQFTLTVAGLNVVVAPGGSVSPQDAAPNGQFEVVSGTLEENTLTVVLNAVAEGSTQASVSVSGEVEDESGAFVPGTAMSQSISLTVNPPAVVERPEPEANIKADPASVTTGGTVSVTVSAENIGLQKFTLMVSGQEGEPVSVSDDAAPGDAVGEWFEVVSATNNYSSGTSGDAVFVLQAIEPGSYSMSGNISGEIEPQPQVFQMTSISAGETSVTVTLPPEAIVPPVLDVQVLSSPVAVGQQVTLSVTSSGIGEPSFNITLTDQSNPASPLTLTAESAQEGSAATNLLEVVSASASGTGMTVVFNAQTIGTVFVKTSAEGQVALADGSVSNQTVTADMVAINVNPAQATSTLAQTQPTGTGGSNPTLYLYTVKRGDTISGIALAAGISIQEVVDLNKGNHPGLATNPNSIQPGWVLLLPVDLTPTPLVNGRYIVQPGDNLYRIGLRYNMLWTYLASANGATSPYDIYPGQSLVIPGRPVVHVVQSGERLYRIGLRYGVTYQAIAAANGLVSPYIVYPGQVLLIPN